MTSRARIVSQNAQMKMKPILKELSALNPSVQLGQYDLQREMTEEEIGYFKALGI
jgi:hypothetical protein